MNRALLRILINLLSVFLCAPLWGFQREVRSEIRHIPTTPVDIRESSVRLVEVFAKPTQIPTSDTEWSRIRYVNRKGLAPSRLLLEGEAVIFNRSAHAIEVIALTVMPLNAFRQPLDSAGQEEYEIHQIEEELPRGSSKRITWNQTIVSSDVYAVAILVTAVRFVDGSIWVAPREAVQGIFSPLPRR